MSDFVTPWAITHQAPLSMEFSRQEYWSGLPLPSPVNVLNYMLALVMMRIIMKKMEKIFTLGQVLQIVLGYFT